MDGKSILSEPITGERSHMRMQGALSRHIKIPAGKHTFKVTVTDEGGRTWNATGTRELTEASDATLFVELKGIVKRSLDLTWY